MKDKIFLGKFLFTGVSALIMHMIQIVDSFFKNYFPLKSVINKTLYPLFEKYFIKLIAGNM